MNTVVRLTIVSSQNDYTENSLTWVNVKHE